jgi:hypothetical protein
VGDGQRPADLVAGAGGPGRCGNYQTHHCGHNGRYFDPTDRRPQHNSLYQLNRAQGKLPKRLDSNAQGLDDI